MALLGAVGFSHLASAQTQPRRINSKIQEISINGAFEATIIPDTHTSVSMDPKLTDKVVVEVKEDKLVIRHKQNLLSLGGLLGKKRIKVDIHVADIANLEELEINGSSKILLNARNVLIKDLDIEINGASEVSYNGQAQELDVEISGSSTANINARTTQKISYDISGASKLLHTGDFEEMNLDVSGSSEATLSGTGRELEIDSSGVNKINASALKAQKGKVESSGMSKIKVNIRDARISADLLSSVTNQN